MDIPSKPLAVTMAKIVSEGEQSSVAIAAVLRLVSGFQETFLRLKMGLLACLFRAMNIADSNVESLIFGFVVNGVNIFAIKLYYKLPQNKLFPISACPCCIFWQQFRRKI